MISALVYLQIQSARNRLRARLRRLKSPKYLIGGVIGGLYLGFYFFWIVFAPRPQDLPGLPLPDPALAINFGALLLLTAAVLLGWVLPNERAALAFTEAEINFLFPAPITRRQLINYKLLRSQIGILISVIFLTLIWGRWRQGGQAWISALGWWTILSALNLHTIAASFARTMLLDRGITNLRRRIAIITALVVVIGFVCVSSQGEWPPFPAEADFTGKIAWLKEAISTGAAPYVLYPFRLIVRPYFAPDAASFFLAWAPALLIIAAHYFIVIRANVAFEEASVTYSQKLATRITAMRERRVPGGVTPTKAIRAPFRLAPLGPPAVAFLWKNLILAGSFFNFRTFIRIALIMIVWFSIIFSHERHFSPGMSFVGFLCAILLFASVFIGQSLLRFDLRSDLNMAEQLLSYPLRGWQIVLGEILAPVAILSAVQWLLILGAALFISPDATEDAPLLIGERIGIALTAAIVVPALDFIMLIIPNAVAILFPSWVRFDKNAPRGIENFGQVIIVALGQFVVMAVAVLPAVLGFLLTSFLLGLLLQSVVILPLSAVVAVAILAVEGYFSIILMGKALEHFDLSAETTN